MLAAGDGGRRGKSGKTSCLMVFSMRSRMEASLGCIPVVHERRFQCHLAFSAYPFLLVKEVISSMQCLQFSKF